MIVRPSGKKDVGRSHLSTFLEVDWFGEVLVLSGRCWFYHKVVINFNKEM
jgi:hypothetical protein